MENRKNTEVTPPPVDESGERDLKLIRSLAKHSRVADLLENMDSGKSLSELLQEYFPEAFEATDDGDSPPDEDGEEPEMDGNVEPALFQSQMRGRVQGKSQGVPAFLENVRRSFWDDDTRI